MSRRHAARTFATVTRPVRRGGPAIRATGWRNSRSGGRSMVRQSGHGPVRATSDRLWGWRSRDLHGDRDSSPVHELAVRFDAEVLVLRELRRWFWARHQLELVRRDAANRATRGGPM